MIMIGTSLRTLFTNIITKHSTLLRQTRSGRFVYATQPSIISTLYSTKTQTSQPCLIRKDYTVGWVCAIPIELAAAQEMLDEEHPGLPQDVDDSNIYTLGRMGEHNVVIACLPAGQMGNNSAASVAVQMKSRLNSIRFGLMVGIGGGVPSAEHDVRLGDVVVSQPFKEYGGVVQYDFGKTTPNGFVRTGFLNAPPTILLNAVASLRAKHLRQRGSLSSHLSKLNALPGFTRDHAGPDVLFDATYRHTGGTDCRQCNEEIVQRQPRDQEIVVHFGTIASGNQVMRDATTRDRVSSELGGVLCFEMEAAGLMNSFPCLVIRGICDYADSHKNKKWQAYAAGTAAACAKEILSVIPAAIVATEPTAEEFIKRNSAEHSALWLVPFERNPRFTGRQSQLASLEERLFFADNSNTRIAIWGLGGVGKTQLMLELAHQTKDQNPNCSIIWIPATNIESLEQSYLEVARKLSIPGWAEETADVKRLVQAYLSKESAGQRLLVFDNADDIDMWITKSRSGQRSGCLIEYLLSSKRGCIIFTTRDRKTAVKLAHQNVVEVPEMDENAATQLLRNCLVNKDLVNEKQDTTALLAQLTYLPLAIVQAAAYINENGMKLADYLLLLSDQEEDVADVLSEDLEDNRRYHDMVNPVATTWLISFEQIQHRDPLAADYLSLMACVDPKDIPLSLLPSGLSRKKETDAIGTLDAYSFINKRSAYPTIDLHRLVHLATRNWLRKKKLLARWTEKAIARLEELFLNFDQKNRSIWRMYLPHARYVLESTLNDKVGKNWIDLAGQYGLFLYSDGRWDEAEVVFARVVGLI